MESIYSIRYDGSLEKIRDLNFTDYSTNHTKYLIDKKTCKLYNMNSDKDIAKLESLMKLYRNYKDDVNKIVDRKSFNNVENGSIFDSEGLEELDSFEYNEMTSDNQLYMRSYTFYMTKKKELAKKLIKNEVCGGYINDKYNFTGGFNINYKIKDLSDDEDNMYFFITGNNFENKQVLEGFVVIEINNISLLGLGLTPALAPTINLICLRYGNYEKMIGKLFVDWIFPILLEYFRCNKNNMHSKRTKRVRYDLIGKDIRTDVKYDKDDYLVPFLFIDQRAMILLRRSINYYGRIFTTSYAKRIAKYIYDRSKLKGKYFAIDMS